MDPFGPSEVCRFGGQREGEGGGPIRGDRFTTKKSVPFRVTNE